MNSMITVTNAASTYIHQLLQSAPGSFLRLSIDGGGCSGFQYTFLIDSNQLENDHLFDQLIIDDISLNFLKGSEIDYEDDLMRSGLVVRNPNATSSCGCGNSFSP